jgi:MraZ protein
MDPAKEKFELITSFYGATSEMDPQGRILIPTDIREDAELFGDVVVIGKNDHLEVWNRETVRKDVKEKPLTREDRERMTELGF